MKSVMKHSFSEVPKASINRSSFDRSHGLKTTFDVGNLVPFFVDEVLPGDTFNARANAFARLATPIHPIMDNMFMETFFFAVPLRLVWDNFQKFMGEQRNPGDSTDYLVPTCTSPVGGYASQSLQDYMGLPTQIAGIEHSNLPLRAYNLIWNEWFRDQNLQDSLTVDVDDGPDDPADYVIQKRGKRHDYFTSALPWPQKGDAVELPLGTTAPVVSTDSTIDVYNFTDATNRNMYLDASGNIMSQTTPSGAGNMRWGANTGLETDLSTATAATINQLRQAFQIQKLLERDARGGSRYIEIIKSHFGVTSPDARLQRPEYLGGGSTPVNINPIAQTSSTDATTPQGNMSANGTVSFQGHGFTKSFTEHCIVIGLVNVRADITYQQGLNRMWSRQTRYDFYWPALANIGEQTILNKEIYADGSANDDLTFGYQERYAEYRYKPSYLTGKMRSSDPATLEAWHLSEEFSALPVLGPTFITDNTPLARAIAVPSEPHFIFDMYMHLNCVRPMPMFGVPGLIDHF